MYRFHCFAAVLAMSVVAAAPAAAGDFTKWKQPPQPQWCHIEVERLYQSGDKQPLHAVLVNKGLGSSQFLLVALKAGEARSIRLGSAQVTLEPGARADVVLNQRLDAKDAVDGFTLSIPKCS